MEKMLHAGGSQQRKIKENRMRLTQLSARRGAYGLPVRIAHRGTRGLPVRVARRGTRGLPVRVARRAHVGCLCVQRATSLLAEIWPDEVDL
jgi:hypothetical protein